MGFCSKRHFLLTICTLQLITTTERQVFDFLGYMWVPILVNFFNVIFVIFGFFGALQYRSKYIITYCVWNVIWLAWNVFLSCFYLDAGGLDKTTDLLNFGTGSFSWWLINGPGCNPYFNRTIDRPDFTRPERPDSVTGCVLDYEIVEVVHSSIQCLLSIMAIISGIFLSRAYMEEDDSFDFVGGGDFGMAGHTPLHPMYVSYSALPPAAAGHKQSAGNESYYYPTNTATLRKKKKQPRPLYSIEYSQPEPPIIHDDNVSPKPMTPRRVKRRSVISRDGTRRSSRRSSVRQSRRKNPVNRIMDHQESLYANSPTLGGLTSLNVNSLSHGTLNYDRISGHWSERNSMINPPWQLEQMNIAASSPNIWNQDSTSYPNVASNMGGTNWESASSTRNLTENWQQSTNMVGGPVNSAVMGPPMHQWQGQSNPTFQQTSTQSLNGEDVDDLYGNRPASARSSYSNYHGVRATPQVPQRTDHVRQSQRQFHLSGGPPAYADTVI